METKVYNQISQGYQVLSDRFSRFDTKIGDNSRIYPNGFFLFREENIDFYEQFKDKPFSSLFKDSYLREHGYAESYYASPIIATSNFGTSVHYEFSIFLFHFLIHKLGNLQQFLDILHSEEFQKNFSGFFETEKYQITYSLFKHQDVYIYFTKRIENFEILFDLLHRTNSGLIVNEDNHKMQIKTHRLKNILNGNVDMYDFTKLKL